MAERVLEPLEMTNSTYEQPLPERLHARAATAYQGDGEAVEGGWHVYPEMAAAGLWTTPTDLAKYAMEVQRAYRGEGRILSREMTREMLRPGKNDHGLGPSISGDRFGHGGSTAGFRCQLTAFIDDGRGAVVMTNSDNGSRLARQILITIFDAYGWEGMEPVEKTVVVLEPEQYEALAGTYRLQEIDQPVEIAYRDGELTAMSPGAPEARELLAESETDFFLSDDGTSVRFLLEDGTAAAVVFADSIRGEKIR